MDENIDVDEKTNEIGENMNEKMGAVKFDPVLQRILDKLQERGYTGKQLETHLKLTNGSVTKWKIRNGKSYFRHIVEIAEFLGTTPSYLLDGNMLELGDLTIEERNLIMDFRMVDKKEQNFVAEIVKKFSQKYPAQSKRLGYSICPELSAQS